MPLLVTIWSTQKGNSVGEDHVPSESQAQLAVVVGATRKTAVAGDKARQVEGDDDPVDPTQHR